MGKVLQKQFTVTVTILANSNITSPDLFLYFDDISNDKWLIVKTEVDEIKEERS